jgi:vacuolar-type H+-ATPase subunit H
MDDSDLLQHLLEIETQASVLVDDAQAEADRRIKSAEEQNRLSYDKQYQTLVKQLEEEYREQLARVKDEYHRSLEEYRCSLDAMPFNGAGFSALASSLLLGEK